MNPIELSVFSSRIESVCEEMGAVLKRAAFSPNIKDRLDFSCAVFDAGGNLCAQAAHIPVHLGSMAYAMADIVGRMAWREGDMVVVNDPYLGGTHLPDVTLIAPVFVEARLQGFVANRAHHANIGAASPGSMPISTALEEEGVVIAPTFIQRDGRPRPAVMARLCGGREGAAAEGDFAAQISANRLGVQRLSELIAAMGKANAFQAALVALNDYGERLAAAALAAIPDGDYTFTDFMDDDGVGGEDIAISVCIRVRGQRVEIDFDGTAAQVKGNINCPLSVAAAAVYYVFRCLMPAHTPACAGSFRPLRLRAPHACLLNAERPAAVAAGNVETSTRIVDVVLGALAQALPERIPAASHGSMNNIAMGAAATADRAAWDYYETIGGGMGAGPAAAGWSGVQTHMTNTLNTPIESLEQHYPLRILRYALRPGSGGSGRRAGGLGIVREFQFLAPAQVTLLTERRRRRPWGLAGGGYGAAGVNRLDDRPLPGKCSLQVTAGQVLTLATPGGGGWGGA
ncbi:hydantoinase B/oxoprolinase family protein [Exilibacterium tricleocarpae]|uniref:Hydantoinase B/oxoprolinase family protein n=1 Tax=Exilibacterium tricleocarpae TaxID=2591008 RepID=A0A545U5L8_9GAMM|nr:hydantoinase B/oxoprolinase family protein [Exilibacterium tricleocarpae]TQV84761.1 hydantoinase B/oxoprolinase family protein [Exilibacterium tricleocarpae]